MSLVGDPHSEPFLHSGLHGVGFGMITNGGQMRERVRVVVTFEALAEASHVIEINRFGVALAHFDSLRSRVEAAASQKFDRIGTALQAFEGVPTVLLMTGEPM
jgi:hypothetical protein